MTRWLRESEVRAMHFELLAEHGGLPGVRSPELLESALARPQNLAAYGEPSLADLAASYAFGIAKNHPFADGNKRVAFAAAGVFLILNGWELVVPQPEAVEMILALAAGEAGERELSVWIAKNLEKITPSGAAGQVP
jgi:death-on-curing protein